MKILSVDPGKHRCGVALGEDGLLGWAGWIPSSCVPDLVERERPDVLLMENPKDYARFAVAHKDLDSLRDVLKAAKKAAKKVKAEVRLVSPSEWKGNVPKPIHHTRIEKILSPEEKLLTEPFGGVGSQTYSDGGHNAWDAIALLKFGQGAVGRGGKKETT